VPGTGTTISGTTSSLTATVTGLTSSTAYTAYVEPLNIYQTTLTNQRAGTTGKALTTSSVPAAPTNVNVTLNVANAKIQWTAPANPTNPVTSYSVTFKKSDGSYIAISGHCSVSTTSCEVPMSTLTSALGWTTSTASNYVDVKVYATNSDGTSPASSFTADGTSSTLYVFAPQIAPTIVATTSSTT
jgi:hypothetical protein